MKVSIQGNKGSFHDIVARKLLGEDIELLERGSFKEVFDDVKGKRAEIAVTAIENSIAGTIVQNYDLLLKTKTKIVGEYYLRIEHQLMALEGQKLEDIKEVWSHPMAIAQCEDYLERLDVKVVEKEDTAGSAKEISEKKLKGIAAIAPKLSAEIYGLGILAPGIETNKQNYTRFWLIDGKNPTSEEPDKCSISVILKHEAGSLAKLINVFSKHKVNMTKIESRPILGQPFNYRFFIDFELNYDTLYSDLLQDLNSEAKEIIILGKYKKSNLKQIS